MTFPKSKENFHIIVFIILLIHYNSLIQYIQLIFEKQMVMGLKNHYNQKEERLSQLKVQVEIVQSTIQKRYLFGKITDMLKKNIEQPSTLNNN